MGLKGSDLISSLQTFQDKLKIQKNPQGLHHAGSQDFISGSGDRQQRILVELGGFEPPSEITTLSALHA